MFGGLACDVERRDAVGFGVGGEVKDVVDERLDAGALLKCQLSNMDQFGGRIPDDLDTEQSLAGCVRMVVIAILSRSVVAKSLGGCARSW